MNAMKWLVAGAALTVIAVAFRDFEAGTWLRPTLGVRPEAGGGETEPILGYDGMDQETIIDWLGEADLDRATLLRMRRYEAAHRSREPVLAAIDGLL